MWGELPRGAGLAADPSVRLHFVFAVPVAWRCPVPRPSFCGTYLPYFSFAAGRAARDGREDDVSRSSGNEIKDTTHTYLRAWAFAVMLVMKNAIHPPPILLSSMSISHTYWYTAP